MRDGCAPRTCGWREFNGIQGKGQLIVVRKVVNVSCERFPVAMVLSLNIRFRNTVRKRVHTSQCFFVFRLTFWHAASFRRTIEAEKALRMDDETENMPISCMANASFSLNNYNYWSHTNRSMWATKIWSGFEIFTGFATPWLEYE